MKKIASVALAATMLWVLHGTAGAGPWATKVTGEATMSNYPGLTISVSAWKDGSGGSGGQVQYEFWQGGVLQRKWHMAVEAVCFGTTGGVPYVTAVGPAKAQEGTSLPSGTSYAGVSIRDSASGADRVRAGHFEDLTEAMTWTNWCNASTNVYPAIVGSGGYDIVTR